MCVKEFPSERNIMKRRTIKFLLSLITAGVLFTGTFVSAFATNVKIPEDGIRVRSEASTSGDVVATGSKGSSYEVLETVAGSDGYTWYKIKINDSQTGYVRGDLVKVEETAGNNDTGANADTPNTANSLAPTTPTAIQETTATITGNSSVNIRSGAGTGYALVGTIPGATSITLIGEANDASGNKWYQFKCDSKNMEGYVRSDLVTVSEEPVVLENQEGENPEEQQIEEQPQVEEPEVQEPETPENNDYEVVYTTDDDGVYQYYLYDHVTNTRQKVTDLLSAISTLNESYQSVQSQLTLFKVIAIVCGILAVAFVVVIILLVIKSRNSEEEYYEDDFEDDDEDDDEPQEEIRYRSKTQRPLQRPTDRPVPPERPVSPERPARGAQPERRPQNTRNDEDRRPRRAQNFLADEDEFEFEFLNIDSKD